MPESYLVIGGSGFLGRAIVEALLARGEGMVSVIDIVQRHFDKNVQFFSADISEESQVSSAFKKVCIGTLEILQSLTLRLHT
jgi:sterol-4alpha-carboxylate 3-dehydrogenase (decarboxylating)